MVILVVIFFSNIGPSSQIGFKLLGIYSNRLSSTCKTYHLAQKTCHNQIIDHHIQAFRDFTFPSSSGKLSNLGKEAVGPS